MSFSLLCPTPGCPGRLPYVNAKMSSDKSIRIWRRACPECGLQVTDCAVYSREIAHPGRAGRNPPEGLPGAEHPAGRPEADHPAKRPGARPAT